MDQQDPTLSLSNNNELQRTPQKDAQMRTRTEMVEDPIVELKNLEPSPIILLRSPDKPRPVPLKSLVPNSATQAPSEPTATQSEPEPVEWPYGPTNSEPVVSVPQYPDILYKKESSKGVNLYTVRLNADKTCIYGKNMELIPITQQKWFPDGLSNVLRQNEYRRRCVEREQMFERRRKEAEIEDSTILKETQQRQIEQQALAQAERNALTQTS